MGIAALASFAANVLVPQALSIPSSGAFFLASALVMAATVLLRLGLDKAVVKVIATAAAQSRARDVALGLRSSLMLGWSITCTLAIAAAAGGWAFLADNLYHNQLLSNAALPISIWLGAEVGRGIVSETLRGTGNIWSATLLGDPGRSLVFLASLVACMKLGGPSLASVCACAAFSSVVLLTSASLHAYTLSRGEGKLAYTELLAFVGYMLPMSLPFFLTALSSLAMNQGDVIIGGFSLAPRDLALYAAASKTAMLLGLPVIAVNLLLAPRLAQSWAIGDLASLESRARGITSAFALIALPAAMVFIFLGGQVMGTLFPAAYRSGGTYLALLALGNLSVLVTGPNGFILLMTKDGAFVARVTATVASLQAVIMVFAAHLWGAFGLATASSAGPILLNLFLALRLHQTLHIRADIGIRPWRNLRFLALDQEKGA